MAKDIRPNTSETDTCEETAAIHFARLQSGDATEQDFVVGMAWRRADSRNQSAWGEVDALWNFMGALQDDPEINAMREQALENASERETSSFSRWPFALAACMTGLVAASGAWLMLRDAPSGDNKAAVNVTTNIGSELYASSEGHQKTLRLSDGSTVRLNGGSRITVAMSTDRRDIRLLQGQAFFDVHKDRSRPFIVQAGALTAKAVGTAFDVRLDTDSATVTTREGLVQVDAMVRTSDGREIKATPSMVPAGSKLSLDEGTLHLAKVDAVRETLWTRGLVAFSSECLATVAQEINRNSVRKIAVSPSAADLAISGVFKLTDALALTTALEQQGLVEAQSDGGTIKLLLTAATDQRTKCRSAT
jgi:transmembrane sensor